jgi:hypothetical protein
MSRVSRLAPRPSPEPAEAAQQDAEEPGYIKLAT